MKEESVKKHYLVDYLGLSNHCKAIHVGCKECHKVGHMRQSIVLIKCSNLLELQELKGKLNRKCGDMRFN